MCPVTELPHRTPPDHLANGQNWEWLRNHQFSADDVDTSIAQPIPITIASGDTFTVPAGYQYLFGENITVSGNLVVNGDLIDVSGTGQAATTDSRLTNYICLRDEKAVNTNGGTFTAGSYVTRTVTEFSDTGNHCSVASNVITFSPGNYRTRITCPAFDCGSHKARLRDTTGGKTLLVGTSAYADATTNAADSRSEIVGRFTVGIGMTIEIQHQCTTTSTNPNGLGVASNLTEVEVYTVAEFWKEG